LSGTKIAIASRVWS